MILMCCDKILMERNQIIVNMNKKQQKTWNYREILKMTVKKITDRGVAEPRNAFRRVSWDQK